uniref:Uncharacterized protein n=1 Tax=Plectus sambesii TaxID=2011161 RepID=A0A914UY48_9BILA
MASFFTEAGKRYILQTGLSSYVGISDAASANVYRLADGTLVPPSLINPLWAPTYPRDPTNALTYITISYAPGMTVNDPIGFLDVVCGVSLGVVCQLQL